MTIAVDTHAGPWTEADLADVPDEYGRRCELLEGALVVNPPPSGLHQLVSAEMLGQLRLSCPKGLAVVETLGVRLPDHTVFIPDVLVAERDAVLEARAGVLDTVAVRLVVEIVSPGSRTTDRLSKPALYAAAGIPGFWRVELEPQLAVVAHRLEDGRYAEASSAGPGDILAVDDPFPIRLDPASLQP